MMRKLAILFLIAQTIHAAPAPYPFVADSQSGDRRALTARQANGITYRVTFRDGGQPVSLTSVTPYMVWATGLTSTAISQATPSIVNSTSGIVDFVWSPSALNTNIASGVWEVGLQTAGIPRTYTSGAWQIMPDPYASGAPVFVWTTNSQVVIADIDWSGVFPVANIPNLPQYVPTNRTLTINGVAYSLDADRSWTVTATVIESDPVFTNWLATNVIAVVETDPVFKTNGVTYAMTNGWIVSSHLGFLTSESDPLFTAFTNTPAFRVRPTLNGTNVLLAGEASAQTTNGLLDLAGVNAMTGDSISFATDNIGMEKTSYPVSGQTNGVWIGSAALYQSPGAYNCAAGYVALYQSPGSQNSAAGYAALYQSPGSQNIAAGYTALYQSPGSENSAMGSSALYQSTGSKNSAMGCAALCQSPGSQNSALGFGAGYYTGGTSNLFLGSRAGYWAGARVLTNAIAIGAGSVSLGSHSMVIGNPQIVSTRIYGTLVERPTVNGTNVLLAGEASAQTQQVYSAQAGTVVGVQSNLIASAATNGQPVTLAQLPSQVLTNGTPYLTTNDTRAATLPNLSQMSNVWVTAGKVGLGTTNPATTLDVNGDTTIRGSLIQNNTASTNYFAGNIGVGTTNPIANLDVHQAGYSEIAISSDRNLTDNNLGDYGFYGKNSSSANTAYAYILGKIGSPTAGTESGILGFNTLVGGVDTRVMTLNSGNVGIGTNLPSSKLSVNGDIRVSPTGNIYANSFNGISGNLYFGYSAPVDVILGSLGAFHIYGSGSVGYSLVLSGGKLGIGTNAPATPLDVNGASTLRGAVNHAGYNITGVNSMTVSNLTALGGNVFTNNSFSINGVLITNGSSVTISGGAGGGGISNVVVNGKTGVLSGTGSNVMSTVTLVPSDVGAIAESDLDAIFTVTNTVTITNTGDFAISLPMNRAYLDDVRMYISSTNGADYSKRASFQVFKNANRRCETMAYLDTNQLYSARLTTVAEAAGSQTNVVADATGIILNDLYYMHGLNNTNGFCRPTNTTATVITWGVTNIVPFAASSLISHVNQFGGFKYSDSLVSSQVWARLTWTTPFTGQVTTVIQGGR